MSLRNEKTMSPTISFRRNWTKYSKVKLVTELSNYEMDWQIDDVQSNWNKIENILVKTTDKFAPLCKFMDNVSKESQTVPPSINRKLDQRRRLLAKLRQNPDDVIKRRVKNLNTEIKNLFIMNKRNRVRKGKIPGNLPGT